MYFEREIDRTHIVTSVDATCCCAIISDFESDDGLSVTAHSSGRAADVKFQVSLRTRMRMGKRPACLLGSMAAVASVTELVSRRDVCTA